MEWLKESAVAKERLRWMGFSDRHAVELCSSPALNTNCRLNPPSTLLLGLLAQPNSLRVN
jgi:hypothetical protein